MKKTITFLQWYPKRDDLTDNFVCRVKFSVIDSDLIGTPREVASNHQIVITISDILLSKWQIPGGLDFGITEEMVKVALQVLEEHITQEIKTARLLDNELESIILKTENSPEMCPYSLANIQYPSKTTFIVDLGQQDFQGKVDSLKIEGNVSGSTIIIGNENRVQYTEKNSLDASYEKIERLMPALVKEMRDDLNKYPTKREFVILRRGWIYNSSGTFLAYYLDEHEDLEGKLRILENLGLIREITYNSVRRFVFQEKFVDYLTGI